VDFDADLIKLRAAEQQTAEDGCAFPAPFLEDDFLAERKKAFSPDPECFAHVAIRVPSARGQSKAKAGCVRRQARAWRCGEGGEAMAYFSLLIPRGWLQGDEINHHDIERPSPFKFIVRLIRLKANNRVRIPMKIRSDLIRPTQSLTTCAL